MSRLGSAINKSLRPCIIWHDMKASGSPMKDRFEVDCVHRKKLGITPGSLMEILWFVREYRLLYLGYLP